MDAVTLAGMIDQTLLSPKAGVAEAEVWVAENANRNFAALCVAPVLVPATVKRLERSPTRVCSVCGFPLGYSLTSTKADEARELVALGCEEVDMVLCVGELLAGDDAYVRADIALVALAVANESGGKALVKVILETGYLAEEQVTRACMLAEDAGAQFVKTSTGFGPRGASVRDVELMNAAVGGRLGIKAAGGIRDLDSALALIDAGATRLGTSAGERLVEALATRGA